MTEEPSRRISPWWIVPPALVFGLQFAAVAAGGAPDSENGVYQVSYIVAAAISAGIFAGYAWLAANRSHVAVRPALALVRPAPGALRSAAVALAFIVVVNLTLEPLLGGEEAQGVTPERTPAGSGEWVTLIVAALALCLFVPFGEELLFRGLGFATITRHAVPVTAALFAIAHSLPELLPVVFLAGLALGELRRRTGSVLPGMACHGLLNLTALVLALATV